MDGEHKKIEPNELKLGMNVAYPLRVRAGWDWKSHCFIYFRYPIWTNASVKWITPKRTKLTLEIKKDDGKTKLIEVNPQKDAVYEFDAEMEHENMYAHMYEECERVLINYVDEKWKAFSLLPDAELREAHEHLTALDKVMRMEK